MEILQTTAKMQQSQLSNSKVAQTAPSQSVQELQKAQIHQEKLSKQELNAKTETVSSQEQMDKLVEQLNRSLDPFNTALRFGFDNSSNDFYVSVIETQSNRILRRFPEEEAQMLLPKMQEVTGLLFDHIG